MNIGKEIRALRESKGISQKEFADMIHITPGYLSRIEKGSSHPPYDTILNIYTALNRLDPLTLQIEARKSTLSPAMEQYINNIKLLPHDVQDSFAKATQPFLDLFIDYNKSEKEK